MTVMQRPLHSLAVVALLSLGACKKSPPAEGTKKDVPPAVAADQVLQQKLHASIDCLNQNSSRVFEARETYLKDLGGDQAPAPGKEVFMAGISDSCRDKLAKAAALTPAVAELDAAATAYVAALGAVKISWDKQDGYFKSGEFRTDGGVKGTAQHTKLMADLAAFAAAHRQLDDRVRVENRRVREADLAAREKAEGRNLKVILDTLMLEAESVIERLPGKPELALQLDLASFETGMDHYAKLVDEFDAYVVAHGDEAKKIGSIDNLRTYTKTFLGALRAVVAKLHAKAAPTPDEMRGVDSQYNSLVDNYNRH